MEPYNVKIITFPDLTKQVRVYRKLVEYVPSKMGKFKVDYKNPFNDDRVDEVNCSFDEYFDHVRDTSMRRTKSKVYNYAKCNNWDYFVTFTFSKEKIDRYDYDQCVTKLSQWLKNLRKRSPGLSYLVVPEQHKDGAWHFHGLFAGLEESEIVWSGKYVIRKESGNGRTKFRMTDRKIYRIGRYRLGFMTATEIQDKQKVVSYITKYITKDMMRDLSGKKRYWCSRNLLLPTEEVFTLDQVDCFVLSQELLEDCSYHKVSQRNDFTTQRVEIFDLV